MVQKFLKNPKYISLSHFSLYMLLISFSSQYTYTYTYPERERENALMFYPKEHTHIYIHTYIYIDGRKQAQENCFFLWLNSIKSSFGSLMRVHKLFSTLTSTLSKSKKKINFASAINFYFLIFPEEKSLTTYN